MDKRIHQKRMRQRKTKRIIACQIDELGSGRFNVRLLTDRKRNNPLE